MLGRNPEVVSESGRELPLAVNSRAGHDISPVQSLGYPSWWGGGACGGNLTQSQGEFFSPHYPSNYQNNARCTWTLLAGELQVVSLNFTFVNMESCCDFIRVYNGPTAQHSLLGSVTGNQIASFNSSSRYMTVVFSTDGSVTGQGFQAQWSFK
ncbi:hypothetical protein QTP86_012591 [Hemibagrus guttatus]|nr:hypothetical protein QTP86_012591 [Hemibagrus guttatus]